MSGVEDSDKVPEIDFTLTVESVRAEKRALEGRFSLFRMCGRAVLIDGRSVVLLECDRHCEGSLPPSWVERLWHGHVVPLCAMHARVELPDKALRVVRPEVVGD